MPKAYLKVLNGLFEGQRFPVTAHMTIGRSPDCRIHLVDNQVSRHHARIDVVNGDYIIRDINSANGTFVNDEPKNEAVLAPGDTFMIGTTKFEFSVTDTPLHTGPKRASPLISFSPEESERAYTIGESIKSGDSGSFSFVVPDATKAQQKRIDILMQACIEIPGERDLEKLADKILHYALQLVPAHRCAVLLAEEIGFSPIAVHNRKSRKAPGPIVISTTIVNKAVTEKIGFMIQDASDDAKIKAGASVVMQQIRSAMCVPMINQGEVIGVLYMDSTGTVESFLREDLVMLSAIAGPAAIAVSNAKYLRKVEEYAGAIERSREQTLAVIANTIEGRDHYTVGHVWRVTRFAQALAEELGWDEKKVGRVRLGGLLHDIGKIAVDDAILHKTSALSREETIKMRIHPEKGASMLKNCEALEPAIPFALYHHEKYDGAGYPFGLSALEIPEEGRLLAIADTFDAMTSNRPYRKGLDPDVAISEIEKNSGIQFDPQFCRAFIELYRKGRISSILQDYGKGETSLACPFCSTFVHLPATATKGDTIECPVCHHKIVIKAVDGYWMGEME
jgi:putative nucleotidyltransferase with HDIG domain